jgi:tRNA threonylcarbamoyl adenosine modification protein YeaZ
MILALDTSSAACTAALIGPGGKIVAAADERIGRGHAERLAPMIAELLGAHVPTHILVGVGPGSFTGIRVAIAAAHGLSIGWQVPLLGINSLALCAVAAPGDDDVAVVIPGGHGEWFVQSFSRAPLSPAGPVASLAPADAAREVTAALVVGAAAAELVALRGSGQAVDLFPSARDALRLPEALRSLDPRPAYARAPDARPLAAA